MDGKKQIFFRWGGVSVQTSSAEGEGGGNCLVQRTSIAVLEEGEEEGWWKGFDFLRIGDFQVLVEREEWRGDQEESSFSSFCGSKE